MNMPIGQKGGAGRGTALRRNKLRSMKRACGALLIYCIAVAGLMAVHVISSQITTILAVIGALCILPIIKMFMDLSALKKLQNVPKYQYDKISMVTAKKDWMTLLSDLFIATENGNMTLWLTVVTGGNIYMYIPAQHMKSEEIEGAVAALIAQETAGRRIYAYENFDDYEDMIMMLAANRPVKKEDDSEQICENLISHAR